MKYTTVCYGWCGKRPSKLHKHAFRHFNSNFVHSFFYIGQEKVYKCLGTDVLTNAFEGYNACLFAYGQTG